MPNPIKYSTSAQTLALKKGNFWIGTGDVGKGPTSTTDYYNGVSPSGGYAIYLNKASGGPSIYRPANDSQLVSLTNTISSITTNYISNGGNFSNGTVSPFIYDYTGSGGVARVVSIANDRPYTGSTSTNALEFNYNGGRAMDTTGLLTVGQTYTFSFWAKITSGSSFSIGWNNQNGQGETNSWSSGGFSLTTSWKRYSQVFTYNAARTTFYFSTRNQTVGTLAVFTEFQLSLGSAPCGPGLTTAAESINWFLTQTDKMVFNIDYPAIVTNGLVMNLDAGFTPSITSLPTNIVGGSYGSYTPPWYDVSSGGNNGSLINGSTFSSTNGGSIVFDGVDDTVSFPAITLGSTFTITQTLVASAAYNNLGYMPIGGGSVGGGSTFRGYVWFQTNNNSTNPVGATVALSFNQDGEAGGCYFILPTPIPQYTSFQYTLVKNGSTAYFYINGSLMTTQSVESARNFTVRNLGWSYSSYYMNRNLYSTQIYNRSLSSAEVLQNYNAQSYLGSAFNPASSASAILAANPSAPDGYYWINTSLGARNLYCIMSQGGWMGMTSELCPQTSNVQTSASWETNTSGRLQGSNTSILNVSVVEGGCGDVKYYQLQNPSTRGLNYTQSMLLMQRVSTIGQCSAITGGTATGYYTGPEYTGTYTGNGMCLWGDGIFANGSSQDMTNLKTYWVLLGSGTNPSLYYQVQCAGGSGQHYHMWFIK